LNFELRTLNPEQGKTMQVPVMNLEGETVGDIELRDAVFGQPLNEALLHQAVLYYRNNLRQGTHDTKTRGQVRGGGHKPYRQKGTGNARQGSRRAPHYRGGGTVFGPHPRSYAQQLPRKMRRQAIKVALSSKAAGNQLIVIEDFDLEEPRTKDIVAALGAWGIDSSALFVMGSARPNVVRSLRNVPRVKALPANSLGVLALLSHRALILSRDAVAAIHSQFEGAGAEAEEATAEEAETVAEPAARPARARRPAAKAAAPAEAESEEAESEEAPPAPAAAEGEEEAGDA
jgi:large subunit ribosomal protein L4